jgi:glutathione synthase/RimK-type ligase-like ATP-grasp enzyme
VPGRRSRLAVAASEWFPDLHDDWPLLRAALDDAGVESRPVVWSDPDVDWATFDLVLANGAWDHTRHPAAFLAWVDRLERLGVPLVNTPATLRWNLDKHYLRDLEEAGLPIVPTVWVDPPRPPAGPGDGGLAPDLPDTEVVVKPAISGGGHLTARYGPEEHDAARAHIGALTAQGQAAMVQPYVAAVDDEGETGLVFLGGAFSHAIHKEPMIRRGVGPLDNLIDNQVVTPALASRAQLALGERAVAAAEDRLGPTTYARVDMVERDDGTPAVLELELLDPVLFFDHHRAAAVTFARVLGQRLAG